MAYLLFFGNDTIDPYPLFCRGAKKILIVKADIFEELRRLYEVFRQGLADRSAKRTSDVGPKKAPLLKPIPSPQRKQFLPYTPSNAVVVNECDYRRWCRVNEWFGEFGPEAEKFEGVCFDSIKMDT